MPFEAYQPPEGFTFRYVPECPSTNDLALEYGAGSVVVAGRQSAARGRMGRSFSAEDGGLYVSVCVAPPCPMQDAPALAALMAVAARDAIGGEAQIKWPNDIYMGGKKVCGILSESKNGLLIFGFGINITNELPAELTQAGRVEAERESLLTALMNRVAEIVAGYPANREALLQDYAHNCCTLDHLVNVTYRGMPMTGFACGIDKHGGLMVMTQESRTVIFIYSGEATLA